MRVVVGELGEMDGGGHLSVHYDVVFHLEKEEQKSLRGEARENQIQISKRKHLTKCH